MAWNHKHSVDDLHNSNTKMRRCKILYCDFRLCPWPSNVSQLLPPKHFNINNILHIYNCVPCYGFLVNPHWTPTVNRDRMMKLINSAATTTTTNVHFAYLLTWSYGVAAVLTVAVRRCYRRKVRSTHCHNSAYFMFLS